MPPYRQTISKTKPFRTTNYDGPKRSFKVIYEPVLNIQYPKLSQPVTIIN